MYTASTGTLSAWNTVGGEPSSGVGAAPTIAALDVSSGDYTIFVPSADGSSLLVRSWSGNHVDAAFVPVGGAAAGFFGAVDAGLSVWGGVLRLDLVRINKTTGRMETSVMGIERL